MPKFFHQLKLVSDKVLYNYYKSIRVHSNKMTWTVCILLWKDLLYRKNHPFVTSLEIMLPMTFVILINVLFEKTSREYIDNDQVSFETFQDVLCTPKYGHYGSITYEPSTPFTNTLMSKAACYAGYKKSYVKPGMVNDSSSYFNIGVKFQLNDSSSNIPNVLNYTLYPKNILWVNLNKLWRNNGRTVPKYSISTVHNLIELQRAIDASYLAMKNVTAEKINLQNTDMHSRDVDALSQVVYFAVLLLVFFMIPPVASRIIEEKTTGAKELLLMVGVRKIDIWVSKFLDACFIQLISVTGVVVFFYVPLKEESMVLDDNPVKLWAVIMFGIIGTIIFLFFLSCLCQHSVLGVFIIITFCIITFLADNYFFTSSDIPGYVLYITSALPHTALVNAVFILLLFEQYGKPVNLSENVTGKDDAPVLYEIFLIMIADIIIYTVLTWYFENVFPGKFGIPKSYYFFCKKSYWSHGKVNVSRISTSNETSSSFEAVPSNIPAAITIQNVTKSYSSRYGGDVVAVSNVTLMFYKGEISCVLGHNGAGKTTLFSMITGLTFPTSGNIIINGYNIQIDIEQARRSFGLCPQQDMLFNYLTPIQILKFYGLIKGLSMEKAKSESFELLEKLKLFGAENTNCSKLSGGQKRKVSLAIALIGGSQILILDEPTSGMDPEIRRQIWELLLKYRGQRTILLTTHFMEEADALADRIAIMDHGKVKCYGSSMFLKSKFGKGYILNVVLQNVEKSKTIIGFVKQHVSNAKLKSQNIRTLSFEIPENKADAFPSLLYGLEEKQKNNEIISYSVNVVSLEDVFLTFKSGKDTSDKVDSPHYSNLDISGEPDQSRSTGCSLIFVQFWILLIKKWIVFRKSFSSFFMFCTIPVSLVVLDAYLASNYAQSESDTGLSGRMALSYSLGLYKPSVILYTGHDESDLKKAFKDYIEGFGSTVEETVNITETVYQAFKENFFIYSRVLNLGVEFLKDEINIFHNRDAVHMVPVSLNLIHNFLLNYTKQNSSIFTSVDATYVDKDNYNNTSSPSPPCPVSKLLDYWGAHSFFYIMGPVRENHYGAKELQLMVTSAVTYWLSHLLWDVTSFFLLTVIIYMGMGLYPDYDSSYFNDPVEVLSAYFFWCVGLLLICYVISSFLKNLVAAFSLKVLVYGIFTYIVFIFIKLELISEDFQYLHPSCLLKIGLLKLCKKRNYLNFIWMLCVYDAILFCFLILKDSKILSFTLHRLLTKLFRVKYSLPNERKEELVEMNDEAVKRTVKNKIDSNSVLLAYRLKRWYFKKVKPKPAVRGVSFIVNKGECFGLLGVNGAGKTSTFKMLTGEIASSKGKIFVCSKKLTILQRQKYLFSIGYCPQMGGLIPLFNGREMLTFFARLRGLKESEAKNQVENWLIKLGLLEFAKKNCGTYSGGNQRKLSTGVSLIGDCPLIFLDEPTTGVDPLSRRSIWNIIGEIQNRGHSIILTSHSMDECEALCSRVAIMVNGKFRCIGETTTLKDKFGQGYSIRLKISVDASSNDLDSLKRAVVSSFPDCELVDEHLTILQYKVSNKTSAADVFKKLMDLSKRFTILESYSASAATLEQIFIGFAREKN